MKVVVLNSGEMATARQIATTRRYVNEVRGIREHHFSADEFGDELMGAVAELAFAKWQNVYPDVGELRAGAADCVLPNGRKVDVKAVPKRTHRLIAPAWKTSDAAHLYVLAYVDGNRVEFIGWAEAGELICDERKTDLGYGPTYVLPQDQLHRFDDATAVTA
jgi:hypothetical protein